MQGIDLRIVPWGLCCHIHDIVGTLSWFRELIIEYFLLFLVYINCKTEYVRVYCLVVTTQRQGAMTTYLIAEG